ncbi:MAG: class I SAM-dependent methyltransferase [Gallionellaceae bacterium]|nr:class I SAM-dependent methyltransferase [Gallionellaceae bacterium]
MITWDIDESLLSSPAITNRNLFAQTLASQSAEVIITQYAGLTPQQIEQEFSEIFAIVRDLGIDLHGTGLELGAGVGVLSAVAVNCWPDIEQLYALEVVPKVIELLQPQTVRHIAPATADKILGVLGSFDDMRVPDGHFDFCIEYASLHHSDDLLRTLRETARTLKPGAPLIAIDRAHYDGVSGEQLRFMLDVHYSAEWKRRNGYSDAPLSRARNGEHEIRMREWLAAFAATGFEVVRRVELRPTGWRQLRYKTALMLPFRLRRTLGLHPSRVRPAIAELIWLAAGLLGWSAGSNTYLPAAKEHTLFIARKRP